MVKAKTGLVVATYFSGPKIQWILDNVSGARAAGERGDLLFGNIDTWVIWWLTGGPDGGAHVTDYSNASRTMLMDLKTLDWDAELLSKIKVPRAMLPQIRPSSDRKLYGQTKANGPVGGAVPVCSRRTGTCMPVARSSGSPVTSPARTWSGPRSRPSATRRRKSRTRWRRTRASSSPPSRWTAGRSRTTS